jgi:hypothetical protein
MEGKELSIALRNDIFGISLGIEVLRSFVVDIIVNPCKNQNQYYGVNHPVMSWDLCLLIVLGSKVDIFLLLFKGFLWTSTLSKKVKTKKSIEVIRDAGTICPEEGKMRRAMDKQLPFCRPSFCNK